MVAHRKEDVPSDKRIIMDKRNERKRHLREERKNAGKSVPEICSVVVQKFMCGVISNVVQMAKARERRRISYGANRDDEIASMKIRNAKRKTKKDQSAAAKNSRGNFLRVENTVSKAIKHILAMAHQRDRQRENRNTFRARINKRKRDRRAEDPQYRMRTNLSVRFANFVRESGGVKYKDTEAMTASTFQDIFRYLQSQTPGEDVCGMEIDHIFPMARFNCMLESEQRKVMNWTNFQPLTAEENLHKSNRLPTKAMAAKVARWAWPDGVTEDMLPDIYDGWATPLRMRAPAAAPSSPPDAN